MTRKKIRVAQVNMGMHHQYDPYEGMAAGGDGNDDYDNPKVLVSCLVFIFQKTQRTWSTLFLVLMNLDILTSFCLHTTVVN